MSNRRVGTRRASRGHGAIMSEPGRLREQTGSGLELALLQAGTAYRSSAGARAKTLSALGLAGSVALSTSAAGGGFSSLLAKLGWTKLAISAALAAGALPAGYYVWFHTRPARPAPAGEATLAVPVEPVASAQPPAPTPTEEATSQPLATDPSANAARPVNTESGAALTAEVKALDAVRAALAQGDAGRALTLLDSYSKTYPRGRLELEAEVLRIDALARSGQSDLARNRANLFLKRHPKSVLASRVRGYL
jgi:hypothetical protein